MRMHLSSFLVLGALGATASCSGQYKVGDDPGAGGAGGGTSTGSSSTGGAAVGASSHAAHVRVDPARRPRLRPPAFDRVCHDRRGGSTTTGTGGQAGAPPQADAAVSRCNFASDTNGSSSGPTASGTIVASRIHLFLDNDPTVPATVPPPAQAAAPWADRRSDGRSRCSPRQWNAGRRARAVLDELARRSVARSRNFGRAHVGAQAARSERDALDPVGRSHRAILVAVASSPIGSGSPRTRESRRGASGSPRTSSATRCPLRRPVSPSPRPLGQTRRGARTWRSRWPTLRVPAATP